MNTKLVQALARLALNPCDINREEVLKLMKQSEVVDSPLEEVMKDTVVLEGIKLLSLSYMEEAIRGLQKSGGFDEFYMGTDLGEQMQKLSRNKSFKFMVQAILLVAFAIAKGGSE